jgi:calcium-dependent protein kinase
MTFQFTTQENLKELQKVFKQIDINGDGSLSRDELIKGFANIMNSPNPEQEVDNILAHTDVNQNGFIDYEEFILACQNRTELLSSQNIQRAFNLLDKNQDGQIDLTELKLLLPKRLSL